MGLNLPEDFYNDFLLIVEQEAEHFLKWNDRLESYTNIVPEIQELEQDKNTEKLAYGYFPTSDRLWDSAKETNNDLKARLAIVHLVHEARGLDTYLTTRNKLMKANDNLSVDVLDHNYQEEINHVRIALNWFLYLCKLEENNTERQNVLQDHFSKGSRRVLAIHLDDQSDESKTVIDTGKERIELNNETCIVEANKSFDNTRQSNRNKPEDSSAIEKDFTIKTKLNEDGQILSKGKTSFQSYVRQYFRGKMDRNTFNIGIINWQQIKDLFINLKLIVFMT